jgi:hypothetical protein
MPVFRAGIPIIALACSIAIHLAVLSLTVFDQSSSPRSNSPVASFQLRLVPAQGLSSNADSSVAVKEEGASASSSRAAMRPGDADYLPKNHLSLGPEPLAPIEIQSPEDLTGKPSVTVVLWLFIDEYGKVQKIRVESTDATQSFVDAALKAFGNATFKPGTLKGKAVKSVIKVAAEFEQR